MTSHLLTFTGELRPLPTHVKSTYNCHNRSGFGKYLLTMHALMKMIFTVKLQHNIFYGPCTSAALDFADNRPKDGTLCHR